MPWRSMFLKIHGIVSYYRSFEDKYMRSCWKQTALDLQKWPLLFWVKAVGYNGITFSFVVCNQPVCISCVVNISLWHVGRGNCDVIFCSFYFFILFPSCIGKALIPNNAELKRRKLMKTTRAREPKKFSVRWTVSVHIVFISRCCMAYGQQSLAHSIQ
jgi:hypothetical protein